MTHDYYILALTYVHETRECLTGYVVRFNNTFARPDTSMDHEKATRFVSEQDAADWARRYLPAYRWRVEPIRSES